MYESWSHLTIIIPTIKAMKIASLILSSGEQGTNDVYWAEFTLQIAASRGFAEISNYNMTYSFRELRQYIIAHTFPNLSTALDYQCKVCLVT